MRMTKFFKNGAQHAAIFGVEEKGAEFSLGGRVEHLVVLGLLGRHGPRHGGRRRRCRLGLDDLFGKSLPGLAAMSALHLSALGTDGLARHLVPGGTVRTNDHYGLALR